MLKNLLSDKAFFALFCSRIVSVHKDLLKDSPTRIIYEQMIQEGLIGSK